MDRKTITHLKQRKTQHEDEQHRREEERETYVIEYHPLDSPLSPRTAPHRTSARTKQLPCPVQSATRRCGALARFQAHTAEVVALSNIAVTTASRDGPLLLPDRSQLSKQPRVGWVALGNRLVKSAACL